jgi:hypothetical protein
MKKQWPVASGQSFRRLKFVAADIADYQLLIADH